MKYTIVFFAFLGLSTCLVFIFFILKHKDRLDDICVVNKPIGIIDNHWLEKYGLDTKKNWDNVMTDNNVTYGQLYLLGLELEEGMDYGVWLARGLEPHVDTWLEEADQIGDLTKIRVWVTGPASNDAVVVIGPIRHVGNEPIIYTIRSSRSYSIQIKNLYGTTGLVGRVEIQPVEGMVSFTKNNFDFILK